MLVEAGAEGDQAFEFSMWEVGGRQGVNFGSELHALFAELTGG